MMLDSQQAVEILERNDLFAEERVQELFSLLALPDLEQAVFSKPDQDSTLDVTVAIASVEAEQAARLLHRLDGRHVYPQTITSDAGGMEFIIHQA